MQGAQYAANLFTQLESIKRNDEDEVMEFLKATATYGKQTAFILLLYEGGANWKSTK